VSLRVASSLHIVFFPEELGRVGPKNLGEGSTRQLGIWSRWSHLGHTSL